ncbi:MAG: methylated-DNA--[protein]-cysteine S-methyltransferase [Candidatus Marinimicrobia bacterium]|jgi:O-6-methylguanine DNA methyltransferase|nr:methylated-DNA--[protein]-cysteine S-methyltransferase [Candidatus Neomarinimicrobiota bacterium]MBT7524928.1 methylated-DNA--[protein]-cysteine S-methyltransferase [Candidatus Neomarinimicrobiota bacterium]MDG2367482.1 methylated-DNA--[protein]-cysteine S-methyltransferase [Candidatus Neomarinimicrobiota bacterium]
MIEYTIIDSPIGKLLLAQSYKGLNHIIFENKIHQFESIIFRDRGRQKITQNNSSLSKATHQLNEYFSGYRKFFELKLDLTMPPFYYKALMAVKSIPYGQYQTYKEIAMKAGNPKAVRAAGTANARNPIPIVIPCHRVLASNGGLGGYGGGLNIKNFLLNLEGTI